MASVAQTVNTVATSKYAERKGYRIQPSPGYEPGGGSPLRQKPQPAPASNPGEGSTIVKEMIENTLEDLEDHEEWRLHCSGVTMWSWLASLLGMFMILMSRALTPLFYSLETDDILFGFGIVFQLPLVRWFIMLCYPRQDEKKRRKVIRVKHKERARADLRGNKFQIMVSYCNIYSVTCIVIYCCSAGGYVYE